MKKLIAFILLAGILIFSTSACASANDTPAGIYIYEKDGFGGSFSITLNDDGTFSYCEGTLSSYMGVGEWTVDGDVICLSDRETASLAFVNYFKIKNGRLIYIEDGSTNFMYVRVSDGECFNLKEN